jgi:hypothetical protein
MEQVEEGKYATATNSTFHLEKTDYEPRKPATQPPVGI